MFLRKQGEGKLSWLPLSIPWLSRVSHACSWAGHVDGRGLPWENPLCCSKAPSVLSLALTQQLLSIFVLKAGCCRLFGSEMVRGASIAWSPYPYWGRMKKAGLCGILFSILWIVITKPANILSHRCFDHHSLFGDVHCVLQDLCIFSCAEWSRE